VSIFWALTLSNWYGIAWSKVKLWRKLEYLTDTQKKEERKRSNFGISIFMQTTKIIIKIRIKN
jgi:hypothetical protein